MEKLETKHLGRRLAYGVKAEHTTNSQNGERTVIDNIECISIDGCVAFEHSADYYIGFEENQCSFKLVLHPLSDLTKPITHKGETFVPIYKLWELAGFEIGRGQYVEVFPNYIQTSNFGTAQVFKISLLDITSSNYNVVEKLLEWNFILDEPEGTWIDVNTLETNPYK